MVDFHSHILPCIDDGSKSVEESLKMLSALSKQGITNVVATPHFYANRNSVEEFLAKRNRSYQMISHYLTPDFPEVLLGAEVKYYEGISRLENLHKLCIGTSKLLLLEMPMRKWTVFILRELRELASSGKYTVVLAHIERYLRFQDKNVVEELVADGILMQANADFFLSFRTKIKAISMLKNGLLHFIGSDCHNLTDRAPKIGVAISYIERKTGKSMIYHIKSISKRFL